MKAGFEFQSITSGYADTVVIREISGHLGSGQVLGILGRNGVGKSTLLKAMSGFLPLMSGSVTWQGKFINYPFVCETEQRYCLCATREHRIW